MNEVKNLVEQVLQSDPGARDDDMRLIISVWILQGLQLSREQLVKLKEVSSPESIRRTRQKFQESGKYRASESVEQQRSLLADQHREYHRENPA